MKRHLPDLSRLGKIEWRKSRIFYCKVYFTIKVNFFVFTFIMKVYFPRIFCNKSIFTGKENFDSKWRMTPYGWLKVKLYDISIK